jgi:hypothetical protein
LVLLYEFITTHCQLNVKLCLRFSAFGSQPQSMFLHTHERPISIPTASIRNSLCALAGWLVFTHLHGTPKNCTLNSTKHSYCSVAHKCTYFATFINCSRNGSVGTVIELRSGQHRSRSPAVVRAFHPKAF